MGFPILPLLARVPEVYSWFPASFTLFGKKVRFRRPWTGVRDSAGQWDNVQKGVKLTESE